MRLIIKTILKTTIILVVFLLSYASFISLYYSPKYLTIKVQNILNSKLYINNNVTVNLPKDWFYLISGVKTKSSFLYLNKNFIKNNIENNETFLFIGESNNNKVVIEFKNEKYIENLFKLYGEKYTTHAGINCIYQAYQKNNKIEFIYIPSKEIKLSFRTYTKDSAEFIDEFCKEN